MWWFQVYLIKINTKVTCSFGLEPNTWVLSSLPSWPVGEGNDNPLRYSCLENPVDRGAWRAAVHMVAQSQTWLKRLSMHAWIGEGNGNPLQYSYLENPRDGGAWWAAVYGVAQSRTRLKWLSSSSRDKLIFFSLYSKYIARSFYSEFVSSYFSSLSVLLRDKNGNWIDRWN